MKYNIEIEINNDNIDLDKRNDLKEILIYKIEYSIYMDYDILIEVNKIEKI